VEVTGVSGPGEFALVLQTPNTSGFWARASCHDH
jgi:hypothetical protein